MSRPNDPADAANTPGGLTRRRFVENSARFAAGATAVAVLDSKGEPPLKLSPGVELEEKTIADLSTGLASGQWTSRKLTQLYLERIAGLDQKGPMLRHVLETNPDALRIADTLDAERKAGKVRGPLHGIPILIKDNIATADKMQTTAGSLALIDQRPRMDATVAAKLREAGAILLAKTNLSEWANFRSSHSSSGWSARGGQGRNPYALDRTPSGSSSGSGGATAANYAAASIGTETDGSVTAPAAACSLVGIKPTIGLVSRAGIIPIAASQDTAGPMTRTVRDAAILLSAIAGTDPRDRATAASDGHVWADYTRFLKEDGLRGARIGLPRENLFGYSPATDKIIDAAIDVLKKQRAIIVDPANIPHLGEYDSDELNVLLYELKDGMAKYLEGLEAGARMRTLADLITFNKQNADREMPYFGQEFFERSEAKGPLTEKEYRDARDKCVRLSRGLGIDAVMDKHRLDALVAPTMGPPTLIDLVNGDPSSPACTTAPAVAGYPHITVPAGYAYGLPVGISFFGRAWTEPKLLRLAYAFEQATNHRRPPKFPRTAALES
jgi:amidase